jgi:hypothetical protein
MCTQDRIQAFIELQKYLISNADEWIAAKELASYKNGWFTKENIAIAVKNIYENFLDQQLLENFCNQYSIADTIDPKKVGIVMAGNIPLVGFHDLLCVLLSGHIACVKLSSKDDVLMKAVIHFLQKNNSIFETKIIVSELLKNCDAYIATGSNNSALYFENYFSKWPHIIRKNKTSIAILTGTETNEQLKALAQDIHLYFGLGCRNVTKIFVPEQYNFEKLLNCFDEFKHYIEHHKYKNNYDYNLAIYLLNNQFYMTNGTLLLVENDALFSPISSIHYSFYKNIDKVLATYNHHIDIQCIIGYGGEAFGEGQKPSLMQYADGIDVMAFLQKL